MKVSVRFGAAITMGILIATSSVSGAATKPKPITLAKMKSGFLTDVATLNAALSKWNTALGSLGSNATWTKLGHVDQPFASALTKFDVQLLAFGANGKIGSAIAGFVRSDQNLIADLTTAAGQNLFTGGTWETQTVKDEQQLVDADTALRSALGVPKAA